MEKTEEEKLYELPVLVIARHRTTANELARTLVEKGKGNTVYTIEDDIADEKAKGIYRQSEDTLAKYIKEANGDEEKGIHAMKSELPGQ